MAENPFYLCNFHQSCGFSFYPCAIDSQISKSSPNHSANFQTFVFTCTFGHSFLAFLSLTFNMSQTDLDITPSNWLHFLYFYFGGWHFHPPKYLKLSLMLSFSLLPKSNWSPSFKLWNCPLDLHNSFLTGQFCSPTTIVCTADSHHSNCKVNLITALLKILKTSPRVGNSNLKLLGLDSKFSTCRLQAHSAFWPPLPTLYASCAAVLPLVVAEMYQSCSPACLSTGCSLFLATYILPHPCLGVTGSREEFGSHLPSPCNLSQFLLVLAPFLCGHLWLSPPWYFVHTWAAAFCWLVHFPTRQ